jgi:AcrR family transcriptional regulator
MLQFKIKKKLDMPPKQKITKQEILNVTFQLVRESGAESINARAIAHALKCSTQPIFHYYASMVELKADVFAMAYKYHSDYFNKVKDSESLFFDVGMAYIDFAFEEPNIFKLLFMSDGFAGKTMDALVMDDCNENITGFIPKEIYEKSNDAAGMFTDMWLYAHGIASLLVSNQLQIDRFEIEALVRNIFTKITNEKL